MNINLQGNLLDLSTSKVMGILNVTPDSFYDGGTYLNDTAISKRVEQMLIEGADIIDVGGYSTRPFANNVLVTEEIKRIKKAIRIIIRYFPETIISIDTFRSEVAKVALAEGACIINDISGGRMDKNMYSLVAKHKTPYIITHMQGKPKTMQREPRYSNVVIEVKYFFTQIIDILHKKGLNDILIDPGFGFGKSIEHNYELLQNLDLFRSLKKILVVGLSRKSMIYKMLNTIPSKSLNGTTVLNCFALLKGANILRVHDVKEAKETIRLISELT